MSRTRRSCRGRDALPRPIEREIARIVSSLSRHETVWKIARWNHRKTSVTSQVPSRVLAFFIATCIGEIGKASEWRRKALLPWPINPCVQVREPVHSFERKSRTAAAARVVQYRASRIGVAVSSSSVKCLHALRCGRNAVLVDEPKVQICTFAAPCVGTAPSHVPPPRENGVSENRKSMCSLPQVRRTR